MRPRSIVAPMLLISIGILFLLHNVWPEIAMFDLFGRYWPILLIIWGFVRLVEVVFWHSRSKPMPVSGVSGGEWTTVVVLCLLGSTVWWGTHYRNKWPGHFSIKGLELFGEPFEYKVAASKAVGKTPRVVLELGRGNARITGKETDQIAVTGRKTIRAFEQADADKGDKETPLEIVSMGDQIVIRTNQDRLDNSRRATSDLEVTLPKGASFEGRGRVGDFDISELTGNVEVNSDNAGVRVQNIAGAVRLDLKRSDVARAVNIKGPVDMKGRGQDVELESVEGAVTINGDYSGELTFRNIARPLRLESSRTELRVEKIPGMLRLALGSITGENVTGPIRINTRSRDIQLREFTQTLDITLERGDIELRPAALFGRIEARTKNGNVDLVMPASARFELNAQTGRGEVHNDFGTVLKETSEGKGGTLRGATGAGPQIALNVERGSISVRKAGSEAGSAVTKSAPKVLEAPEPPAPPAPPAVPAPQRQ